MEENSRKAVRSFENKEVLDTLLDCLFCTVK